MNTPRTLPPHVAARQALVLRELLRMAGDALSRGEPADATLARFFRSHKEYGSRDRRLFSEVIFSWFRWRGWLDNIEPGQAAALAYYKDMEEPHPAVDALLGERSREIPAQPIEKLVPEWLRGELFEPDAHFARFVESIQKRPPTWLRVEESRVDDVLAKVGRDGPARRLIGGSVGPALPIEPKINLDLLRKEVGPCFEVQDLASQCVGLVCAPAPGETWWDMCAGAGGKSLHLAELMGRKGRIVATDIRESALRELQRRSRDAGIDMISTETPHAPRSTLHDFDGILVDAPCSGIGTWSRNPDMRWRTPSTAVTDKARTQSELLAAAAGRVKPGGALVYSVCTVTRAETVDVARSFLQSHPDFALQPVPHPLTGAETSGEAWIWPWDGPCDGMYVARLRNCCRDCRSYPA